MTRLEQLPARIDDLTSQVAQLRSKMDAEFSAVRVEMADLGDSLRSEMADLGGSLRGEMAELAVALRTEIADQGAASAARDEALGIRMRVLHEDVISRFALLQEGLSARPKRKPRKP